MQSFHKKGYGKTGDKWLPVSALIIFAAGASAAPLFALLIPRYDRQLHDY
jgi:hypothetical protein